MLMGFGTHDYVAAAIAIGTVIVFAFLLVYDAYITYQELWGHHLRKSKEE